MKKLCLPLLGGGIPSPPPPSGSFPQVPPPDTYNNKINNYNDDDDGDDFPLPPLFFPYSSRLLPFDNIPQAPLISTPPQSPTPGYAVLTKTQEKPIEERPVEEEPLEEVHLDEDLKNLFPEEDDVFEKVEEENKYEEENISFDFDFTRKLNQEKIPEQLDFFIGGKTRNLIKLQKV